MLVRGPMGRLPSMGDPVIVMILGGLGDRHRDAKRTACLPTYLPTHLVVDTWLHRHCHGVAAGASWRRRGLISSATDSKPG